MNFIKERGNKMFIKLFKNLAVIISIGILIIGFSGNIAGQINKQIEKLPGKESWQGMLEYTLDLHVKSTHPAVWPFEYDWEEIGPGYCYGPAFGHWDIVHQIFDALEYDPEHASKQLLNNLKNQEANGLVPGSIWLPGKFVKGKARWNNSTAGHPPVWVVAADNIFSKTGDSLNLRYFYQSLIRQITWFENERKAVGEGFFYNDILLKLWESGVDEGVRFDETGLGAWACVDATSHVYMMYEYADKWSRLLDIKPDFYKNRKDELRVFINDSLYNANDGMYYDIWAIQDTSLKHVVIENFWPLISGAIEKEQADLLIDKYLLNESHFLTPHPVPSVSVSDPKFELRMWRGPSWNSITHWIALGCVKYGRGDAAKIILEKALDKSAEKYEKTGTIWEFYHPLGGKQLEVARKPHTEFNTPSRDYLGHNPLIAMAALFDKLQ